MKPNTNIEALIDFLKENLTIQVMVEPTSGGDGNVINVQLLIGEEVIARGHDYAFHS